MIVEVEMFTVECDNCSKLSGSDSEYSCWNDKNYALEEAMDNGWIEENGKHYCPDCYSFGEDEDEVIINLERKK